MRENKAGKVEYRVDKSGIIHAVIGKRSFDAQKIVDNAAALIDAILRAKPSSAKGIYMKKITISTTMGPGCASIRRACPRQRHRRRALLSRAQKEEQVAELKEKFSRATCVYVVDYRGLDVESVNKLRRRVRKEGDGNYEYRVLKNRVLRRAAEGSDFAHIVEELPRPDRDRDLVRRSRRPREDPRLREG